MNIDLSEISINFRFKDSETTPAQVTLIIGQFEVRGFRIMRSKFIENKSKFVLYPPAIRGGGGKFLDIVRVADKGEWKRIERLVLKKFETEYDSYLVGLTDVLLGKGEGNPT